jgi:outer membrane protein assembly factor BamE (lipoprotein component of BamABCDE complex)
MLKKQLLFLSSLIVLFILSGCVQSDLKRPQQHYGQQGNWADQTSLDEESIDISDLDENLTETYY